MGHSRPLLGALDAERYRDREVLQGGTAEPLGSGACRSRCRHSSHLERQLASPEPPKSRPEGPESGRPEESQKLDAVAENFSLNLELASAKAPVIHGHDGISRKSAQQRAASHYISLTRLNVSGSVQLDGQDHGVRGSAWMDHEFFTHEMDPGQVGWDWMSIQLDDETDLMLYRMRRNDGSADPHSSGTLVDAEGRVTHLDAADIVMQPRKTWSSPETGGRYPIEWKVSVPKLGISLDCRTPLLTQEVVSPRQIGPNYWEGAVDYEGVFGGKSVKGVGYLEMTGYDKRLVLSETIN